MSNDKPTIIVIVPTDLQRIREEEAEYLKQVTEELFGVSPIGQSVAELGIWNGFRWRETA